MRGYVCIYYRREVDSPEDISGIPDNGIWEMNGRMERHSQRDQDQ
jgi:hypothetical protein